MNWFAFFLMVIPAADGPKNAAITTADSALYATKIKPLFAVRCLACHGALEQKGGLRVDTVVDMIKGGDTGPGIIPGKPKESPVWLRSAGHGAKRRMPPKGEGEEVGPDDLARLEQWIASGAPAPDREQRDPDPREHWAFKKPVRPVAPAPSLNPIDAWVEKGWREKGLAPRPEADKRTLLRRLHLDLVGLPPTPEEMDRFLADGGSDAYQREVDRLLNSPQHAERWARHFMDIWRYSDWWGLGAEVRNSQKNIWHWRDWIIDSLEKDLPYDEMVRQMLAADELYPADPSKLRATGYLARQYFLFNRTSWMDETIEHTFKAFQGLTANCAKCHDHKYDPITADDYYRLRAVFEPYQVRFDAPNGSLDPTQGFPRAFDCNLDKVTHKHIRGDEARPDTRRNMQPGAPSFLNFASLNVREISLPPEAHAPEIRAEVLELFLKQANEAIASANTRRQQAAQAVLDAQKRPKPMESKPGKLILSEPFEKLDPTLWTITGPGQWKAEKGVVVLPEASANRSALKLNHAVPTDFELTLRLRITGGDPWRSVGVSFDASQGYENNVYVSANSTEPKLQIAYERAGQYTYPDAGKKSRPVLLNTPMELTIRVQGTGVEALLDGKSAVFFTIPDRKPGNLLLTAFTAACALDLLEIRDLPTGYQSPGAKKVLTVEQAKARLDFAKAEVAALEAEPAVLKSRYQARKDQLTQKPDQAASSASQAAKAEADLAVLKGRAALAKAKADLAIEAQGKNAQVEAAQKALADAEKKNLNPGAKFTPLVASAKSPENNLETAESKARPYPPTSTGRRAALARWITNPDNPLTARVIINHLWNRHFGQALVASLFDFGRKGQAPTHPELLDALAVELVEQGWSLRHIHRLIVTSRVYRLDSSSSQPSEQSKDPENKYLWRFPSHRVEAQVLRDGLLHLAGALDQTRGGPPVPVADASSRRRSLYYFHSHNEHQKFLEQFDDAGVLECYRRERSIVPQQALALTHAALSLESASAIAARISKPGMTDAGFIEQAHLVLLARPADAEERELCAGAIRDLRAENGQASPERARSLVVLALLNHHDFLTRR